MFKVEIEIKGTNQLAALERLQLAGFDAQEHAGRIELEAEDYEPVISLLSDLHVETWSAKPV